MSEAPDYWIAYLRELADTQAKQQIAVNVRQAADSFSELLEAAREAFAIMDPSIPGSPGSPLEKLRAAIGPIG